MQTIRYPNLTAASEKEQLAQLKSWLYQLTDQLNLSLAAVQAPQAKAVSSGVGAAGGSGSAQEKVNFQTLKGLILKSGQVVEACSREVEKRLEGKYVTESEFGTYSQETAQTITANSQMFRTALEELQRITSQVEGLEDSTLAVNAHIKAGLLEYDKEGTPIYGVEIGQRSFRDGVEFFNKYARFTADRLAFYDQNGTEVAYISDRKLFITHVQITGTLITGRFEDTVQPDGSLVTRWV